MTQRYDTVEALYKAIENAMEIYKKELIEEINNISYIPGDWRDVSDKKVVMLEDVVSLILEYKPATNK